MSLRSKPKKQKFSGFSVAEAFQYLQLTKLTPWVIEAEAIAPSDFFDQRLKKLQRFDLRASEEAKKLLIDAILEEGIEGFDRLKIWKGANLETDIVGGYVDYLVAEDRDYLYAPFLCVMEAKKDDFEQGLAQCLVEMAACQWSNRQIGRDMNVFGIVTNGEGWKFYQLLVNGVVEETDLYSYRHFIQDGGGVGAAPPARGSTPAPHPNPSGYGYIRSKTLKQSWVYSGSSFQPANKMGVEPTGAQGAHPLHLLYSTDPQTAI